MLVVAVSLFMLDRPVNTSQPPGMGKARLARRYGTPAWAPATALVALLVLAAVWRPATEMCASVPYAGSSPLTPHGPAWAIAPNQSAQRGAPDVGAFNKVCAYHAPNPAQVIYTIYPSCKWAQVDSNYPLVQASGIISDIDLSSGDLPWIHTSHDLEFNLALDSESSWLLVGGGAGGGSPLHVEAEAGNFPLAYRPVAGDRVTVAGRWIFDCGHDPKTEIHSCRRCRQRA